MDRGETQSLERGLAVLACIIAAGALTVAEVAQRVRLSQATARRLLNTLHAAGYVSQSRSHQPYRATLKIRDLANLLPGDARILDAARQGIAEIPASYPWPVAFIQWDGSRLVVRETTAKRPQFEPTHFISGWKLKPPFGAAAFIIAARSTSDARQTLLNQYRKSKLQRAQSQASAFESATAGASLRKSAYYAVQSPGRMEYSIAVPVLDGTLCIGALETRIVSTAISRDTEKQKIIGVLSKCAGRIAQGCARSKTG